MLAKLARREIAGPVPRVGWALRQVSDAGSEVVFRIAATGDPTERDCGCGH